MREFHFHVSSAAAPAAPGDSIRAGAGCGSEGQVGDGGGDGVQGACDVKVFNSRKKALTAVYMCTCMYMYIRDSL